MRVEIKGRIKGQLKKSKVVLKNSIHISRNSYTNLLQSRFITLKTKHGILSLKLYLN